MNLFKRILIFFISIGLLIVIYDNCFSQSQVDSLLHTLNKTTVDTTRINLLLQLSKKIEKANADSSIVLCMKALALANHLNSRDKKAACFKRLAETYSEKPFFEDSEIYFAKEYIHTVDKLSKPLKLADAFYTLGVSFSHVPNHDSTFHYYEKAIALSEREGDTSFAMQVRNDLANTYRFSGRFAVCNDIYRAMYKYYSAKNDSVGIAKSYRGIGIVYDLSNVYDSAAFYFRKAADVFKALNMQDKYASSLQNLAFAYTHEKKYVLAEKTFIEAITLFHTLKSTVMTYQAYMNLSRLYLATGKIKQAIACSDSVVNYTMRENDQKLKTIALRVQSNAYAAAGDYKKAYSSLERGTLLVDSISNATNVKNLNETEARFRYKEKQSQIELLDKEKQLQEAETGKQKNLRNTIALIFLLAIVISSYAFYRFRQKTKQKQEAERSRISRDLHDDVGATLGSISIYSEVAKNKSSAGGEINDVLEKIGDSSRDMLEKMNDIVWAVNPKNDTVEELIHRMKNFAAVMLTPKNIEFEFETTSLKMDTLRLDMQKRKNIFLIFKEALHNIIKYADAKHVNLIMKVSGNNLSVEIKDDGKGFNSQNGKDSKNEVYNGNGIKNMKVRAMEIKGSIEIASEINSGTQINLDIPI